MKAIEFSEQLIDRVAEGVDSDGFKLYISELYRNTLDGVSAIRYGGTTNLRCSHYDEVRKLPLPKTIKLEDFRTSTPDSRALYEKKCREDQDSVDPNDYKVLTSEGETAYKAACQARRYEIRFTPRFTCSCYFYRRNIDIIKRCSIILGQEAYTVLWNRLSLEQKEIDEFISLLKLPEGAYDKYKSIIPIPLGFIPLILTYAFLKLGDRKHARYSLALNVMGHLKEHRNKYFRLFLDNPYLDKAISEVRSVSLIGRAEGSFAQMATNMTNRELHKIESKYPAFSIDSCNIIDSSIRNTFNQAMKSIANKYYELKKQDAEESAGKGVIKKRVNEEHAPAMENFEEKADEIILGFMHAATVMDPNAVIDAANKEYGIKLGLTKTIFEMMGNSASEPQISEIIITILRKLKEDSKAEHIKNIEETIGRFVKARGGSGREYKILVYDFIEGLYPKLSHDSPDNRARILQTFNYFLVQKWGRAIKLRSLRTASAENASSLPPDTQKAEQE